MQSMMGGVGKMWLERAIDKIEQGDLHCISTFCAQGRRRSVSSALILKAKNIIQMRRSITFGQQLLIIAHVSHKLLN